MKEMKELEDRGIPVRERLLLSEARCPPILIITLRWITRVRAWRESDGTTGRESGLLMKIKRHVAVCVGDLFDKETFAEKLKEVMNITTSSWLTTTKLKWLITRKVLMIRWLLPTS